MSTVHVAIPPRAVAGQFISFVIAGQHFEFCLPAAAVGCVSLTVRSPLLVSTPLVVSGHCVDRVQAAIVQPQVQPVIGGWVCTGPQHVVVGCTHILMMVAWRKHVHILARDPPITNDDAL